MGVENNNIREIMSKNQTKIKLQVTFTGRTCTKEYCSDEGPVMAVELADNATEKIWKSLLSTLGLIQREGHENDLVLAESKGHMDR